MIKDLPYEIINGIKCYNPEFAQDYSDYPCEGFAVTEEIEKTSFWCRSRSRLLKNIILKYSHKPKTKFLELGCGTGFFLQHLKDEKQLELTGSDIYLAGLSYAKTKSPNTEFFQLDATANYIQETYDIIGAFDVIEHIDNDEAVIKNVYHSLPTDGYFIVTVPQYQFLWSSLDTIVGHKRRYSRKELITKLKQQGFNITFQSAFIFSLFPFMLVSRLLDRSKPSAENVSSDFEKQVKLPPALNWLFNKIMYVDEFLIRLGISLPFGGSLLVVAKK